MKKNKVTVDKENKVEINEKYVSGYIKIDKAYLVDVPVIGDLGKELDQLRLSQHLNIAINDSKATQTVLDSPAEQTEADNSPLHG